MKTCTVLLAGGSTGGHLYPGIALALAMRKKCGHIRTIFAVAGNDLDREVISSHGFDMKKIGTAPWKQGILKYPRMMLSVLWSLILSGIYMFFNRINAVVGLGGYASFGPVLSAFLLRKKVFLLEQNVIPGKANRFLARFADTVFTQFKESGPFFARTNTLNFGNPVRESIQKLRGNTLDGAFTLLVMGGSQGSLPLDEIFIKAAGDISFPAESRILHITGQAHYEYCRTLYSHKDIQTEVEIIGYENDMARVYKDASLALCRAGATSLAELTCVGIPLIMVPFPYAMDDHQFRNAEAVQNEGGGICIRQKDLTSSKLADMINELIQDRDRLKQMRECSKKLGVPEAGISISEYILESVHTCS